MLPFQKINWLIMATLLQSYSISMQRKCSIELQDFNKHIIEQIYDKTQPQAEDPSSKPIDPQDQETLADNHDTYNRPSSKGPFRPIRNGTIAASIMGLVASAVAPGTMSLPSRADQLGLIPFSIVLILTILLSYYGMIVMEWIILRYKVHRAFGSSMRAVSTLLLIVYTWGRSICMIVIFIKLSSELLFDVLSLPMYSDRVDEIYNGFGHFLRVIIGILMISLNGKYLMMTNIKEVLGSIGKWSIAGILFCMSIIWLTALFGFSREYEGQTIEYRSILEMDYSQVKWFHAWDSDYWGVLLQAAAGVYFTMLNPQFVFPMINHLKDPSRKRVEFIFKYAHLQQLVIYLLMGWLGYLLLAQHQDKLPISPLVITSLPTWPLVIGKIMLLFAIFFRLPLLLFTTKEFIFETTDLERCPQNYKKMNILLSVSALAVAILFRNVNFYFSLIGGTLGVSTAAIIPLLCALKLINLKPEQKYVLLFVAVMGVIIFMGGLQSVMYPI